MLPFWPQATIALGGLLLGAALAVGICRRIGRAARAQAARIEAILAHAIDAAYRRDLRTDTYDYLSPAVERVMGLPAADLRAMPVQDLMARIHPGDHARVAAVVAESRRPTSGRVEYRFRADTGEYRWIADHWAVELGDDGAPAFRSGILRDVTEQRQAEAQLRLTLESIGDGFFTCDAEWRFEYLNAAAERMLGIRREDVIGRSLLDVFPRTAGTTLHDEYGRVLAGECRDFEHLYADWDRWFHNRCFPREGGGFSVYFREITAEKVAAAALRLSESRYRMLFDSIEDGFCIVEVLLDEQGRPRDYRFVEANPAFEEATGLRDAVGRTALELIPGLESSWVDAYGRVALTGEAVRFEDYAEPMRRWFDVYAFRFGAPEARQVAIFFKNVTDRKAAELERAALLERERHARTEAERASRLKDDFLATISHELRTPLNAMLGWAQILARGSADTGTIAQGLGAIERNALAQARLIEDLLDMSRIVSGTIRLDIQPVDLRQLVTAAIETAGPAAEARGIRIQASLDDVADVRGDATRLPQVVWNLLSNAVKFTPRGGEVRVRLEGHGADVRLVVADTGQGIAADFLPHVFERFRQADASTTRTHGGLGLGLAIVKQIVELHGGQVSVHSDGPGHGSAFIVTLPRQPLAPSDADADTRTAELVAALEAPSSHPDVTLADLTVLAVDDEPDALDVIRRVLEARQARVVTATSAHEAIAICGRERPHVLLADIGMPLMDGYDLIREIRALGPSSGGSVPAAALTAFARSEDRTRALLAGYQTHLAKPLQPIELVAAVASLAGRVASQR